MSDLDVTVDQLETAVVVRAAGEVDGTTAQQLEDPLLRAAEKGAVQLDLAKVPYMSSAGLRVLILAAKALQKRGESLHWQRHPTSGELAEKEVFIRNLVPQFSFIQPISTRDLTRSQKESVVYRFSEESQLV